jgi:hypothetical protein
LNDNPVDIGLFQELSPDRVEPGPAQGTGLETLNMGTFDVKNATNT